MATETIGDLNERSRRASALAAQLMSYRGALDVIGHDPKIAAFTVEAGEKSDMGEWPNEATVLAGDIAYPPQMLTTIRDQVEARIKAISDELTGMGVSEPPSRQAPQTPVSASGGAESRPTTQKPASEPPKPASTPPKPSTSHSRGRR